MKYLILVITLALVACSSTTETTNTNGMMIDSNDDSINDMEVIMDEMMSEPDVTFQLTGVNFAFFMDGEEAPELVVNEGDLVRIEFTSTDGFHDWVVDEFDAATEKVQTDGSTYVEFVADKKGTFEYYCSVGQHRANGMMGNLVVQ